MIRNDRYAVSVTDQQDVVCLTIDFHTKDEFSVRRAIETHLQSACAVKQVNDWRSQIVLKSKKHGVTALRSLYQNIDRIFPV